MARIEGHVTWLCLVVAMVICFGAAAEARRSLLQLTCPNPVLPDVNFSSYLGVWYEIGSTAIIKSLTERDLACITAQYTLIESGPDAQKIRVQNDGYNTTSGKNATIIGVASITGGYLRVTFPPGVTADYKIVYLKGDAADGYHTAAVYSCVAGFQSLYILSRKPTLHEGESVESILNYARTQEINQIAGLNQFVLTTQNATTCGYKDN